MSLAKDARVEKIRKHLRDKTVITKSDFLDFVQVYRYLNEAGWVVRPELLEWIERNAEQVRSWLPDIWSLRPEYFSDVKPGSRYTKFEQYDKLVSLGLTDPPPNATRGSPDLGSSNATTDMAPIKVKNKAILDFGTRLPTSAVQTRPALAGSCQQKVWLDDTKSVHRRLEGIRRWLMESAKDLSPDDGLKEILPDIAAKIPDIQDRVHTAQACFDQLEIDHNDFLSEMKRGRDAMMLRPIPIDSPSPEEVPEQVAATSVKGDTSLASIRVESDILPSSHQSMSAARILTGQPQPPPSTHTTTATAPSNSRPLIARRSAMSNKSNSTKTSRKRAASPADSDNVSPSSHRESGSDNEFPLIQNLSSSHRSAGGEHAVSVYDVDSVDDDPPPRNTKRPRVEIGTARRPPPAAFSGSQSRSGINAPEAVMG